MYLPHFEYLRPSSLRDSLAALAEPDANIRPLAGGTDLLLALKEGQPAPAALLSLRDIPELHNCEHDGSIDRVGAGLTVAELASDALNKDNPAFGDLRRAFASAPIRNRATIGGNICNAAACADLPPVLLVSDAQLTIACAESVRTLSLEQFITGPRETALQRNELLVSISFRRANPGTAYIKFGLRQAVNIAIVGVACALELRDGAVSDLRVAVTAASPAPILHNATAAKGEKPSQALWRTVAETVAAKLAPISDIRGSAEYRLRLARVGTVRGLERACERLREASHA
ncbi:MAG: FAD binding domain-containing protein [Candidatus Zixiibacteriota bacterium]